MISNHFWHAGDLQAVTSEEFHPGKDILVPSPHPELLQQPQPLPPPSGILLSASRASAPTLLCSPPPSHFPSSLSSLV
uniref:Psoriasis susceptibility 1 candidate 1 n=1 Tax=Aotus nancymaae TaxID=37293 RepID=A0A2K5CL59_AOTNA